MADFRKWFFAFAVVALLLGLGSSANAQIGLQTSAFNCQANAGNPTIVRAEGLTELVGDMLLNCVGGTPTLAGAAIPLSNVTIFLNTNVTSRLIDSTGLSEATLMIDEPNADPTVAPGNSPIPDHTVVLPPAGSPSQRLCGGPGDPNGAHVQGNSCPETGTFVGVPSPSPYAAQANVFSGRQNSASSVVFLGIPIDAPGTAGQRVIRITNVRGNAFQLGVSSTLIPTQITMFIAVNGSQQIVINNPTQTVAFIQIGLIVGNGTATLLQCEDQNTDLLGASTDSESQFSITVREGFASSFKRRNIALTASGVTSPAPVAQNVPGFPYNTESGFYAPSLFTATPIVGLADFGTRILLRFNNLGAGVHVFVPTIVPLLDPTGNVSVADQPPHPVTPGFATGQMVLTTSDANGNGGFSAVAGSADDDEAALAEVSYSGTTGYATYEVLASAANVPEHAAIPVSVAFFSNTTQNLPAPGQSTVSVSFAPLSNVGTASGTDPIPRFGDTSTPRNNFSIDLCTCDLLFPFVTNQAGFDTGIALANTSLDPFGTGQQQGAVKLYYFGNTAGGGAAPPPFTTQTVPAGQELIFNLSGGGNFGVPPVPGFEGYIISVANFQFCHAFAFISDVGAQKLAEGYLAIQLDFPFNLSGFGSRTGVNGENEGH